MRLFELRELLDRLVAHGLTDFRLAQVAAMAKTDDPRTDRGPSWPFRLSLFVALNDVLDAWGIPTDECIWMKGGMIGLNRPCVVGDKVHWPAWTRAEDVFVLRIGDGRTVVLRDEGDLAQISDVDDRASLNLAGKGDQGAWVLGADWLKVVAPLGHVFDRGQPFPWRNGAIDLSDPVDVFVWRAALLLARGRPVVGTINAEATEVVVNVGQN